MVAILVQSGLSAVFVLLSQAGTGVKGAYDALVAMSVIAYFVPFLFLFASTISFRRNRFPGAIRFPGGRTVSSLLAALGFSRRRSPSSSPSSRRRAPGTGPFAAAKIVILTDLLVAGAGALWIAARRRHARAAREAAG